jgi:predicted DNA-binding transcriptional regulator
MELVLLERTPRFCLTTFLNPLICPWTSLRDGYIGRIVESKSPKRFLRMIADDMKHSVRQYGQPIEDSEERREDKPRNTCTETSRRNWSRT